jgi:hypothetical protein
VAAFDLTFSAPKGVSVLFAIADEPVSAALLTAHEKAVEAYVEREACFTRRGATAWSASWATASLRRHIAIVSLEPAMLNATPTWSWRT